MLLKKLHFLSPVCPKPFRPSGFSLAGFLRHKTARFLIVLLSVISLAAGPAWGAIASDAKVSTDGAAASATIASPSLSTSTTNELLLAFVATDYLGGTNTAVKSVSGAGLTWTLVERANKQSGTSEIWRAFAASPLTNVSVTATLSQSVISSITVMSFSGVNTTGANGSGAIGAIVSAGAASSAPTASLVSTANNSWVLGVGNDFDNATARTLGAGQSLIHQYLTRTGDTYWVQMLSSPVVIAGSTVTINDTAPTKDRYNLSVVEILPATTGASGWNLSGTISPVAGGSGATVTLSGAASATTTADANGNYSFASLANDSYTVTPSKSSYTFTPANQAVTLNGANQTSINFTAQANPTWSISGVLSPAAGGSGATVTLSGAASATTAADANGNYTFASLANGNYTVTPSKSGYTFTPASQAVSVNQTNVAGINFTAQANAASSIHLIQANVKGDEGTGSSIAASFASANKSGNFLIVGGTVARHAGTLSISDTLGNTYILATAPVTDMVQDVTSYIWYVPNCKAGANTVTLTPAAPGALEIHISEWSGISATNPVDSSASATGTGTTASSGNATTTSAGELIYGYTFLYNTAAAGAGFTGITEVNGDLDEYEIQPTAGTVAATFTQTSGTWFARMVTFLPAAAGPGGISGTISPASIGNGATITLTGAANATTTADANGNYALNGLANGAYTVTPSQNSYTFSPASQQVTVNGAVQAGINFTGQGNGTSWSLSGVISPAAGSAGATVTLSGTSSATTAADANGNYSFAGLANGSYTVTPSKTGYTFNPANQPVTIDAANVSGVNFTATAPTSSISIDAKISSDGAKASTSIATPSFSTSATNELLLAFIGTDYTSGANTTVKSIAGAGLTWTLVQRSNGQDGSSEIWRAYSASPLSNVTVTVTLSQSVSSSLTVMSFIGASSSGSNGSGAIGATASSNAASGAPAASLITTAANSWVIGVGNDYDNAITRTVGSGQTLVHQYLAPIQDTYWVQMLTNPVPAPGSTATINDTAPTKDRYNLAIVEIVPEGGGSGSTSPTVSMTSPAAGALLANTITVSATASDAVAVAGVQFLLDGSPLGAEITTAPYSTTWNTTTVTNGPHTLAARAANTGGLYTTSSPVSVTVDNSANAAVVGSWSSVFKLPAVAVDLILLQNNRVLFYQDGSTPTVWDYVQNTFTNIPITPDLFCSGHALLSDGRILVVGGYGGSGTTIGIANAEIFDPTALTWTAVPNMQYRRWYPDALTLSDGRILVTAGWQTSAHTNVGISEIYDPQTNGWTSLTNANNPFETYPFLYLLPDGRVLHIGGSEYPTDTDVLDLATTSWSVVDSNIVDGGSATMYLPGKFMKAGSATDSQNSGPSSNTTFVLDMTQSSPTWKQTASMAYARSFLNLTMLPDGNVLATGGETDRNGGTIANAVYPAELWSPATQTWTTMSAMATPREYHGTALLLPDGRVLVSGMGADFGNVPNEMSAEFFSPPYLFKGARPTITQAPAQIQYNSTFTVSTPDAASIASVTLIRTGAVTHFFDQNERYVPLAFTQTSGGLSVTAPINGNLAPPGYYMLFIVNSSGVPSVAPFVQIP